MEVIVLVVIITSIIQSLFGVGVLLFGTPMLLILNYEFLDALMILLPISASINFIQIIRGYKDINKKIYKNIILLSTPFIIIFLFLVSKVNIDINLAIGIFLLFIVFKEYIPIFKNLFLKVINYDKFFYVFLGISHGITNLGGVLLSAKIFATNLNRYEKRVTIAISYLTFALFQIITILSINIIEYKLENLIYIVIAISVYLMINKFFNKISDSRYNILFTLFLFFCGTLLVLKHFI